MKIRKKEYISMTVAILLFSEAGALARMQELRRVFDPDTGLAEPWAAESLAVMVLSAVAAVLCLVFARMVRKYDAPGTMYHEAFSAKRPVAVVLSALFGIAMLCGAFIYYSGLRETGGSMMAESVLALFAAAAGVAYFSVTLNAYRGKSGRETALCWFTITAFICFWLIITYKHRAADPVILDYVYDVLALCASATAAYYMTGYCYNRRSLAKTVFSSYLSVYFCTIAGAGAESLAVRIFYVFTAAVMLINALTLVINAEAKGDINAVAEGT